ncbi:MAG: LysR family transcriptional regulator [Ruminococcus sp.]|nr:LysR family transcriptional regulator [Ruminococcus sp.]
MTLQQIKYAITIHETGNFSRAAERLYVTQPSLTKAINELEREIGSLIFIRKKSGVSVTDEGEEFISYARQVYAQYEILYDRFIEHKNINKKFGVSCQHYSFAVNAFMETIKTFDSAEYEFSIRETTTFEVMRDVSTMRSEIGIIFMSAFNEKFLRKIISENDLTFYELKKCLPYVFVCRKSPLAAKKIVTFEELQDYPCLVFEQGESDPYFYAEELLPLQKHSRIVKTKDKLTMLNLIAELNGYTLCTGMIYDKINEREFISVPFDAKDNQAENKIVIGYVTKNSRIPTDTGKIYIENIKSYFSTE